MNKIICLTILFVLLKIYSLEAMEALEDKKYPFCFSSSTGHIVSQPFRVGLIASSFFLNTLYQADKQEQVEGGDIDFFNTVAPKPLKKNLKALSRIDEDLLNPDACHSTMLSMWSSQSLERLCTLRNMAHKLCFEDLGKFFTTALYNSLKSIGVVQSDSLFLYNIDYIQKMCNEDIQDEIAKLYIPFLRENYRKKIINKFFCRPYSPRANLGEPYFINSSGSCIFSYYNKQEEWQEDKIITPTNQLLASTQKNSFEFISKDNTLLASLTECTLVSYIRKLTERRHSDLIINNIVTQQEVIAIHLMDCDCFSSFVCSNDNAYVAFKTHYDYPLLINLVSKQEEVISVKTNCYNICFSPDSSLLIIPTGKKVALYNLAAKTLMKYPYTSDGSQGLIVCSYNNKLLGHCYVQIETNGNKQVIAIIIKLWDMENHTVKHEVSYIAKQGMLKIYSIAFNADATLLAVARHAEIVLYDVENNNILEHIACKNSKRLITFDAQDNLIIADEDGLHTLPLSILKRLEGLHLKELIILTALIKESRAITPLIEEQLKDIDPELLQILS